LFAPSVTATPRAVGLELELIPLMRGTHTPALAGGPPGSTSAILSRLGERRGWTHQLAGEDPASWTLSDGARISFEPGGQIEISTAPHAMASAVIDSTRALVMELREVMEAAGIELIARGVDPYNDIDAVPLQLHRERYTNMTRYFQSIGPSGVRMMRQTAALQINVERGADPASRWRLLNALAPIVVALFANSRNYAGRPTEWASYRAQLWRTLDSSRTGIPYDETDPAAGYLRFALDAGAMRAWDGARYRAFRQWMNDPAVSLHDWVFHLSTLFPEVRPKEFFELRSADTIEPESLAAPVVFVTGLIYDAENARRVADFIGPPSERLLESAARFGLGDASLRRLASDLTSLSIAGVQRLGGSYLRDSHIEEAARYFARALAANDI
jgi:glutamate--cysteine ligase